MSTFDQSDRIHELEARVRKLEEELTASREAQENLARLVERQSRAFGTRALGRLQRRLLHQENLATATAGQVNDILNSRIWKTLVSIGGLALRFQGGAAPASANPAVAPVAADTRYRSWIESVEVEDRMSSDLILATLKRRPTVSVIMPVFNPDLRDLDRAIRSVSAQSYHHYELCIADDGSRTEVRDALQHWAATDPAIRLTFRERQGGISEASNSALGTATGEYVAFLDHDDELAQDALLYAVDAYESSSSAPFLYSDEDKIDAEGTRFDAFFKPDWSPDLILSENYVAHLLVTRRENVLRVGGFRSMCDGSQDYDLVLRLSQLGGTPLHIPKVLYHWRATAGSTAAHVDAKEYAHTAARRAIEDHLRRVEPEARVEAGLRPGRWRVRYAIPSGTRASIIIPSGGKVDMLRQNLETLFAKTEYPHYEVLIADNSRGPEVERFVTELSREHGNLRYFDWRNKPFNFSAINNQAARHCDSPILLFLNDDTTVIAPDWLTSMLELVTRREVGAAGARLLYPSGIIQHAGVVMGIYENCGHAFKGMDGSRAHYFDFSEVIRNVSAVTGACLMTRADIFRAVGGFDERSFAVAFNDIDLCLKIGAKGYRVLYTPHALLYHHESFSKTNEDLVPHPAEVGAMRRKWKAVIEADPYYNPNLTRVTEDFAVETWRDAW